MVNSKPKPGYSQVTKAMEFNSQFLLTRSALQAEGSLHLREASEHGFPHCVFVRIRRGDAVGAALGSQAGTSHSYLGLQGKRHT